MKTSCFKYYTGDKGVAICLFPPVDWSGCQYPGLAPERQTFYAIKSGQMTQEEYEKLYIKNVLNKQNPKKIYEMFKDNVLLCWEPPGKFCHRRIVAQWIEQNLGIEVPEWTPADEKLPESKSSPLF